MERPGRSSIIALTTLLAPIAWGTTYVAITEYLPADRPLFVAACRLLPAGLVLVAIGALTNRAPARRQDWKRLTVLSVFNFALFFPLLIAAIYRLPGGVAASVGGLQPLLVAIVGWLIASITPAATGSPDRRRCGDRCRHGRLATGSSDRSDRCTRGCRRQRFVLDRRRAHPEASCRR